jgi:site-specific recombinase XerD
LKDLYKRKETLEYWIRRVKEELEDPDRKDILQVVEHMQDKRSSALWIIRYVNILFLLRRELAKPFRDATKEDIRNLLNNIETKGYANTTIQKDRVVLKSFFKIVYGNNEFYPDQVKWFTVDIGHDKHNEERSLDISGYLEENEVMKLIDNAPTIQKRAFLACLYESGARPEEFLRLSNLDFEIEPDGIVLLLRGKTGQRRVKIILFASLFQQWLELHPLKDQQCYPLWISESSNSKNEQLGALLS